MATPGSGAISMNDMRTHINRATSSSISMSEMRARYGGSGQISFSDLRKCEGFTVTCAYLANKFIAIDGYFATLNQGSVSPAESNTRVQFAANSFLTSMYSSAGTSTDLTVVISSDNQGVQNGDLVTAGYKTTNVTRLVVANGVITITGSSSNSSISQLYATYNMPNTGTIHCLVKF